MQGGAAQGPSVDAPPSAAGSPRGSARDDGFPTDMERGIGVGIGTGTAIRVGIRSGKSAGRQLRGREPVKRERA